MVLISQIFYATQCEFNCVLLHCLIIPRMLSSYSLAALVAELVECWPVNLMVMGKSLIRGSSSVFYPTDFAVFPCLAFFFQFQYYK